MKIFSKLILALSFLFFLNACAVKLPAISRYTLSAPESLTESKTRLTKFSILVNLPTAAPGYSTNRIIYVVRPLELQAYTAELWVAPPNQMMVQILAQEIRHDGYFSAVLTPPYVGTTDFRLETRLILLQQEYMMHESQIHLKMWAGIISSTSQQVIATHTFDVNVPATADAYSGILATNQAVIIMGQKISEFLTTSLEHKAKL